MTELDHYHGAQAPVPITGGTVVGLPPAADTDGWIRVVGDISKLAAQVAHTDFVPRAMQGKPAAIAAAMLAGREMGIGPMTALQNIHVIQGKPGQSALLMRAMVLAKGHHIEFVEVTDTRAVVRGRRSNEQDWTEVTFTADQARKAKIDLGGYPEDKLVARASARLCRRKFADVISGMAYSIEELQDGDAELIEVGEVPPALTAGEQQPAAPARTVKRATKQRQAAPAAAPASRPAPQQPAAASGPPLPGEEAQAATEDEPAQADTEEPPDPNRKASTAQNRKMHALFKEAEVSDRDERLKLTSLLLNRDLDTSAGLTSQDANAIIDALENLKASGHTDGLGGAVNDLLNTAALREHEAQQGEQTALAEDGGDES